MSEIEVPYRRGLGLIQAQQNSRFFFVTLDLVPSDLCISKTDPITRDRSLGANARFLSAPLPGHRLQISCLPVC